MATPRHRDTSPVVRMGRPGDERAIARICRTGFIESSRGLVPINLVERQAAAYYYPARVRDELEADSPRWLGYIVAEQDGQIVGACGGGLEEPFVGHVYTLYLDLKWRGFGIGTYLLDYATEQQRHLGARVQRVTTTEGNDMALPFYRARGFRQIDREPSHHHKNGSVAAWQVVLERRIHDARTAAHLRRLFRSVNTQR